MVVPSLIAAGMETVVARLTRGLARRGHDVGVTCIEFEGALAASLRDQGHTVTLVPTPGVRTIFRPTPLRDWFRQIRPDVVHAHSGSWLKAVRGAALAGVPRRVCTIHGLEQNEPWHASIWNWWAARQTQGIVTVSRPLKQFLQRDARLDPQRIRVIPNGIDTTIFCPGEPTRPERASLGFQPGQFVIGHVARFAPVKNHGFLIEAFARLLDSQPNATLALVGDGPLRDEIQKTVADRQLKDHVRFLGEHSNLAPIYRAFDAFVLPSLAEGTSMSVLEAMATGLPVVASSVGGTPDLLDDGAAGVLVPVNDVPAFNAALQRLIVEPVLRDRLGSAARQRAATVYSEETMLDRYEDIYSGGNTPPLHG